MPDEMSEIMIDCQKKTYGDGLDENLLHPYMWAVKGHYYSTGFSFYNYSVEDLLNVFEYAYSQYYDYHDRWKMMIRNAMKYDVSFDKSAREYEELYRKVLMR